MKNKKLNNATDSKNTSSDVSDIRVNTAQKILDDAIGLVSKRVDFARQNCDILDELTEYINLLDKDEMSKSEKNYLISKIGELNLMKFSEISSIISLCKDKLGADNTKDDMKVIFNLNYGDFSDQIEVCGEDNDS